MELKKYSLVETNGKSKKKIVLLPSAKLLYNTGKRGVNKFGPIEHYDDKFKDKLFFKDTAGTFQPITLLETNDSKDCLLKISDEQGRRVTQLVSKSFTIASSKQSVSKIDLSTEKDNSNKRNDVEELLGPDKTNDGDFITVGNFKSMVKKFHEIIVKRCEIQNKKQSTAAQTNEQADENKISMCGASLDYGEFNNAFLAKDVRKRVNHIVRALWSPEELAKMCVKKTAKTPHLKEIPAKKIKLIQDICMEIQKKSPVEQKIRTTKNVKGVQTEVTETLNMHCKEWVRQVLKNVKKPAEKKKKDEPTRPHKNHDKTNASTDEEGNTQQQ